MIGNATGEGEPYSPGSTTGSTQLPLPSVRSSRNIIVALAVVLGVLGGLLGHDIKRRTIALREQRRQSAEEDSTSPSL